MILSKNLIMGIFAVCAVASGSIQKLQASANGAKIVDVAAKPGSGGSGGTGGFGYRRNLELTGGEFLQYAPPPSGEHMNRRY